MVIDNKYISQAIEVFSKNANVEDRPMLDILKNNNIPNNIAILLLFYIPLAFSRIVCKHLDVQFSDEFVEHYNNGITRTGILSQNQLFRQVYLFVENVMNGGIDSDSILSIAGRSHEFKLVNDALNKGFEAKDLKFSPIQFVFDD